MKKSTKAIAAIMLMTVLMLFVGCKPEDDPNNGSNDPEEIVNPSYVPIDWGNAMLLSSNDSIGEYQILFNGEVPDLQPGSIVTIDNDSVVLYRFVESITFDGNTVRVTSTEAYLTDIFADTDFTLSTAENGKSSTQGKVFYPTEVFLYGDDGICRKLDLKDSRDGGFGFTHNLWHFGQNFNGEVLSSGNNYKLYMEKLNFDFDVDLEIYMNFSGRTVHGIVGNAINRYRSKALNINAFLKGTFNTEQKVRCDIWGSCSWSPGYDIWKHNLFRPLNVKYVVYGVPVIIKINSDLYRQVQLTASGEISAYTGFTDHAEGRLGFEWQQGGGMSPIATFTNTFEFIPPTVEGKGSVEAKVWAFPRIRLLLYGLAGPSFDIKPYLSTKLSGGFKEELLGTANDFCAWSLDCNTGLDACCGLSLQFMGYEVENYSTPNWNAFDKLLYHSPQTIEHVSMNNGHQKRTETFCVYDHNYLAGDDVLTPLPQFVKFEANGQLSSEYGIAHNGRVSVDWTPSSNDILYAKLYDIDGKVMAWDTVKAPEDDRWVDLGLPSGTLWAKWNVGANAPEEYGDYFAWGETTPKTTYNWSTYKYANGNYDQLTKYCNDASYGYNNFTDNLTTLQQMDDAATASWGGGARMPSYNDWVELYEHCDWSWVTRDGVNGTQFIGPSGYCLFLPAAGFRYDGELYGAGSYGDYWSSSLNTDSPYSAWLFYIDSGGCFMGSNYRYGGQSVRAVRSAR